MAKRLVVVAFVVVLLVAMRSLKICVTVQVFAAVVVAKYPARAACARALVKYRFVPSARAVVVVPANCCAKRAGVKVCVDPAESMVKVMLVSEVVANVWID